MKKIQVRGVIVLAALGVFFLAGHFLAPELADDSPKPPIASISVATWTELQDFFDDCLTLPVVWRSWRGDGEAGLVVVLGRLSEPDRFQVLACFEGPDMLTLMAAAGPARHVADLLISGVEAGELLVTSCGTGELDQATRRRFQTEFRAKFLAADKN